MQLFLGSPFVWASRTVSGGNHRGSAHLLDLGFLADSHGHRARVLCHSKQFQDHDLLLERFQHGSQRTGETSVAGEVRGIAGEIGRATENETFLRVLDE